MSEPTVSQTTLDFIAAHTSDVILRADREGRVVYISPSIRAYGYEPDEMLGRFRPELIHPDDLAGFLENSRALQAGRIAPPEARRFRMLTAKGEWVWLEGNPAVVQDEAGRVVEIVNVFRDITHRYQLEEEAREQAMLFEAAFHRAAVGKVQVGLDGRLLRANATFCKFIGYAEAELAQLSMATITHPDDLIADREMIKALNARAVSSFSRDKRYLRADGTVVWAHATATLVCDAGGAARYYVAHIQDLTERRAAEAALRESEARFRLIAENTSDMIVVSGLDGVVTYVSPSVSALGYGPEYFIGHSFTELLSERSARIFTEARARLLATGMPESVRWRGYSALTEARRWMETRMTLIRNPADPAPTGFLEVVRDIDDQVRQEEALAEAMAAAQAAATAKAQFLANMSHEIRTPLTAVLGFAELLAKRDAMDDRARAYIDRIEASGRSLLAIVNDILDFSKLEAGRFEVRPRPADVIETCGETLQLFQQQADGKGLALSFEAAPGVPPVVSVDDDRLRQMLINLIGNAVKFTDAGQVTLRVGPGQAQGWIRLEVADTGPGLDAEAQALLFQRFTQIDGSMTRRHGGTGLGLAICRGVAEAMGGRISVESLAGGGSTFRLDLPAPAAEAAAEETGPEPDLNLGGLKVLVVDDNGGNRELARVMLSAGGAAVEEASDGRSALAALAREPVDAVLMDLRMPGLDGHETLAALRQARGPNAATPVLAFTADADLSGEGDLAGFDGLVRKPIRRKEMLAAVARVARSV